MKYRYDKNTKAIVSTPDCTEEYLDLIWDMAYCQELVSEQELKKLIEEIKRYTIKAKACIKANQIRPNVELNIERRRKAEQEKYMDLNKIEENEEIKENKENVHVAQVRIVVNNISPYEVYVDNKFDSSWNRLENAMAWVSKHVEVFHLEFAKGE